MPDRLDEVKSAGSSAMWFGLAHVLFGLLAIASPAVTGLAVAMAVGVLVVLAGCVQGFAAFREKHWSGTAIGALYVIGGVVLLTKPMITLGTLTLVVAIWLFVIGVWRLFAAMSVERHRGWLIFGAMLSIVLGGLLIADWPFSSEWAIGVIVGVEILFAGIMLLTVGSTIRGLAKDAQQARGA